MKTKNKKFVFTISVIVTALILAVIGFIILPETLVTQITLTGESGTTMPKAFGLAIPLAISVIFPLLYYKSNDNKHAVLSVIGILAFVLVFVFNI